MAYTDRPNDYISEQRAIPVAATNYSLPARRL